MCILIVELRASQKMPIREVIDKLLYLKKYPNRDFERKKKNSFHDYFIYIYSSIISFDLFLCPSYFGKPSSFIK
jgi:hypothetical protein